MRDAKASLPRIMALHPAIRNEVAQLIEVAESKFPANIAIRIVQGMRTIDEQNALYAQGRTKPGNKVTNAKGGSSYHNYGLAIDFALLYDLDGNGYYETLSWDVDKDLDKDKQKDWMEVVAVFKQAGYVWGGDFKTIVDKPHFEKTFGNNWKTLLDRYNKKEFLPTEKFVVI